jgi:hypothetical protein
MKVIPNHNYTVSELKEFINGKDPIVVPWCETFLWLIQDGLTKCNEDLFIVKGHGDPRQTALYMIENYFIKTVRDLDAGFSNSGKTLKNEIKFVVDKRSFKNMDFLTFKYGSCEKDIIKMNCFNTPNLLERKVDVPKPKGEPEPEPEPVPAVNHDWRYFRGTVSSSPPPPPPPPVEEKKDHGWLYEYNKAHPLTKWVVGLGVAYGTYRVIENQGRSPRPIVVIPPKDGSPVDAQPQGRIKTPFIGFSVNINF